MTRGGLFSFVNPPIFAADMGQIQSNIGLITGVPIQETVDQLIELSGQPRDRLLARNNALALEQQAITDLTASVLGVQFSAQAFGRDSTFTQRTATSSNTALLSATVTGTPAAGTYQFTPLQTAQSHQLLARGVASLDDALGEGSITLGRGGFVDKPVDLNTLNSGEGVSRGKIRITDRSGASAEVDLRFAVNVEDVVAAINSTSGIDVTAAIDGDQLTLVDNTGDTSSNLKVTEVSGGSTAADLGLGGIDVAADSAIGSDILSLHNDVLLGDLLDGRGISLRDGLPDLEVAFADGSANLEIDFSDLADVSTRQSATLGDLLDVINAADPARLSAAISSDGNSIELTDLTSGGGTFQVTSPLSGSVAEELGLTGTAVAGVITGDRLQGGLKSTLLTSLGGGQSLGTLGNLDLTDRNGVTDTVDLSSAETLDDVIAAINASSVDIRAQVNSAGSGLLLVDTSGGSGTLQIANNIDGTLTADKLGLTGSVNSNTRDGGNLQRATVSRQTSLTDYGGLQVDTGSFIVTDSAGAATVIDINNAAETNVGDVIDQINAAGIGVTASINAAGTGIQLTDTAGGAGSLTVTQSGNNTTAADLRLLGTADAGTIDGATTYTVEISDTDTLEDVADKLNALGADVTASIFNDGSGSKPHRLSLISGTSGKAGELLIDSSSSGLTFDEIVEGRDARILFGSAELGGVLTSSSSNRFTDLLNGVSLTVKDSSTSTVTVTVSQSDSSVVAAANSFVTQYNTLRDKLEQYTFFNAEDNSTGLLFGSNETLRIDSELSSLLTGRIFGAGSIANLETLGFSVSQEGKLSVDQTKLKAAYADDPEAVSEFFTTEDNGFVDRLDRLIDSFAGAGTSMLVTRSETLSRRIDLNTERIEFMNERLERERNLLLTQFFNLENSIAKLQNNLSAISGIQALTPL